MEEASPKLALIRTVGVGIGEVESEVGADFRQNKGKTGGPQSPLDRRPVEHLSDPVSPDGLQML
ncbi:hypothetical protein A361_26620 [Cytobacillus oceanisediminis 2691]|uniref:Uncharacterized protein n=1 Tax=Cytobacillus oceanisediminis 2691 TaxID=1196031 RepID=A0A160MID8_9BACI|nr:hypothetical protein A361_26620 [Cytobacillus oceanisediminis 2691]